MTSEDGRMNPEIKAEWLRRLRSGNYEQGQGYLHVNIPEDGVAKYCCLGVLCEVAVEAGIAKRHDPDDMFVVTYGLVDDQGQRYDDNQTILPHAVATWAGMSDGGEIEQRGELCRDKSEDETTCGSAACAFCGTVELTALNDSGSYDFPAIANVIEKWL